MDRTTFFNDIKTLPSFKGGMRQTQVDGISAILNEAEKRKVPTNDLAYALATVYHETAATMQPVRETLASNDEEAARRLEAAWKAGKLPWVKTPYWRMEDGHYWFGRSLVQLTHKDNYIKMSSITGVDLVSNPEYAMRMDVALKILFEGMERGSFTGKGLNDFIDELDESDAIDRAEYKAARKIINGTDKADLIAGYAITFEHALRNAGYGHWVEEKAAPAPLPIPAPTIVPLPTPVGNPPNIPSYPPAVPRPESLFVVAFRFIASLLRKG